MKKNWTVELRDNCKVCGGALPNARYRTFCSTKCRVKSDNAKQVASGYCKRYQKARYERLKKVGNSLSTIEPCSDIDSMI